MSDNDSNTFSSILNSRSFVSLCGAIFLAFYGPKLQQNSANQNRLQSQLNTLQEKRLQLLTEFCREAESHKVKVDAARSYFIFLSSTNEYDLFGNTKDEIRSELLRLKSSQLEKPSLAPLYAQITAIYSGNEINTNVIRLKEAYGSLTPFSKIDDKEWSRRRAEYHAAMVECAKAMALQFHREFSQNDH